MKRSVFTLIFISLSLFTGCTDVIEVDVPVDTPRLVIEASLDWQKGSVGNEQEIKLSLSTPYFNNIQETPVTGAIVKVIKEDDQTEIFFTDQQNGSYITDEFIAESDQTYTMQVNYQGEIYQAEETMTSVTDISNVFQSKENGFDKDALEVNIEFLDPENIENFYLVRFQRRGDLLPTLFDMKDEFTDGNPMTLFYEKLDDEETGEKEFKIGDIVDISLFGMSERYYNYMKLLISQSGGSGGPFTSIPAEVKGNCFNLTAPDNYAFGYFRVVEYDKSTYVFK